MKIFLVLAACFISLQITAQQPVIKIIESGKRVSIRGLSVVTDDVIWASGSGGNVARSTDGGTTFKWMKVPGYEKSDFRDIEAFDSNTAIIMGITTPAVILKTKDGGHTWKKVYEDTTKSAFLDAMDFIHDGYNSKHSEITVTDMGDTSRRLTSEEEKYRHSFGMVIGDPIDGKFYYVTSFDGGDHWEKGDPKGKEIPSPAEGEAFFASSGTNVKLLNTKNFASPFYSVTGGKSSNLWDMFSWRKYPLPIMQGKETTGANSLAIYTDGTKGVTVGGDFSKDTISSNNCVLISFGREVKMSVPETPPHGYRSCVIYLDKNKLLTCGTSGIDISKDGGMNWELISKESFHVCQKAKTGNAVFLAGNGRIAKLMMP